MIIKRYNRASIFRTLRYYLRTSKARASWRNAHLLKISGIKTPSPIAFVEKRWGPFLLSSYFVCAFNDFPTAAQKYQHQPPNELELNWFGELLEKMRRARIYHGDLNAHNLLVTDNGIAIIDIPQMQDLSAKSQRTFLRSHHKDQQRFLQRWQKKPQQLKCFTEILEESAKHGRPAHGET